MSPCATVAATLVVASGEMGELGITPRHAPLITRLKPGYVRVHAEGADDLLFYVSGGILEVQPQVVTVPWDAVQRGPDNMYVFVVKPDHTATIQPVTVGQMRDGTAVIEKGLNAGTPIVVAGQYRVQQGTKIRNTADTSSAASANAASKG